MATNVYVDGFNFYNRIYKYGRNKEQARSLKWLDLRTMAEKLAKPHSVGDVNLFSAKVSPMNGDANMPQRQQLWWSALETRNVLVVEGEFKRRPKRYPLQAPTPDSKFADVFVYEEKATDVNLASYLLRDALLGRCDEAIVVSNDSDLSTAIKIAVYEGGIRVVVVSPDHFVNGVLQAAVSDRVLDTDVIRLPLLRACQFPDSVTLKSGVVINKPPSW